MILGKIELESIKELRTYQEIEAIYAQMDIRKLEEL